MRACDIYLLCQPIMNLAESEQCYVNTYVPIPCSTTTICIATGCLRPFETWLMHQ